MSYFLQIAVQYSILYYTADTESVFKQDFPFDQQGAWLRLCLHVIGTFQFAWVTAHCSVRLITKPALRTACLQKWRKIIVKI